MNDKKQRYNTIQKPYNNKYHNNNEKPRLITSIWKSSTIYHYMNNHQRE